MENKIWLSSPHMGGAEMKYVQQAFDENWITPLGPNVNGFETDLEGFLGENVHVAALMSGTSAIHIALILLNVKPDDDVICQTLTFSASANPIIYMGANPVFVDSEIDTWNLCPIALEQAIVAGINKGKRTGHSSINRTNDNKKSNNLFEILYIVISYHLCRITNYHRMVCDIIYND